MSARPYLLTKMFWTGTVLPRLIVLVLFVLCPTSDYMEPVQDFISNNFDKEFLGMSNNLTHYDIARTFHAPAMVSICKNCIEKRKRPFVTSNYSVIHNLPI